MSTLTRSASLLGVGVVVMALAVRAGADDGRLIELSVKDHRFKPAELKAGAGNAILL